MAEEWTGDGEGSVVPCACVCTSSLSPLLAVHLVATALTPRAHDKADERRLTEIVLGNVCWTAKEDAQLLRWAAAVARAVHTDLQHLDPTALDAAACEPKRSDAVYPLLAHHTTATLQVCACSSDTATLCASL